jgi:hypothetical protein
VSAGALDAGLQAHLERVRHGGRFGHREHLHLAWRLLREDPATAHTRMLAAIRHVSASAGVPERAHVTLTRFWVDVVALAMRREGDPAEFDELVARHAGLLRRDLHRGHYSAETLWSERARTTGVPPDLAPVPAA